jgi:hypothetical protein
MLAVAGLTPMEEFAIIVIASDASPPSFVAALASMTYVAPWVTWNDINAVVMVLVTRFMAVHANSGPATPAES